MRSVEGRPHARVIVIGTCGHNGEALQKGVKSREVVCDGNEEVGGGREEWVVDFGDCQDLRLRRVWLAVG